MIGINQPHLFWVATGFVQAWRRAHDITSKYVFPSMCVSMMVHSFTVQGYHYSLTITKPNLNLLTGPLRYDPAYQLGFGYMRLVIIFIKQ